MVTTSHVEHLYTFEEYLTYDDGTDNRYELEDGVLLEMPPASDSHEAIITFLLIRLYQEIQRMNLNWEVRPSGTGVRTTKKKSRLPDLIVMTPEQRESIKGKSAVLEVPPLLVVEVVSAESIKRDYKKNKIEYAAFKIPEYWIVDPIENKVTVLTLENNQYEVKVLTRSQQVVSNTFSELVLTVEQILAS
ncbi:Uma2 family endonuclease [Iningainema tapete]|uniref:Uma2 family endonuclease n=1 Tax=Iningainema tapete BLCC-T55 TaxID=2748662 RepID=A0A8J7BZ26_9CYAN|nr:Uma2 family endonuclease [Iningainema tapete]MBD2776762.1 Uma2 family endonuclease [Iningainema tapete BLCC-T55]